MTTIHLGVIDVGYSDANYRPAPKGKRIGQARRGKVTAPQSNTQHKTTGDVAEILEAKYHIMEIFVDTHEDQIAAALGTAMEGALRNLMAGAPPTLSVTAEAESEIEAKFQSWIEQRGMDGLTGGVPTKAARMGVSHRFLHPYARRASRPSFVDTGLLVANMKIWTS